MPAPVDNLADLPGAWIDQMHKREPPEVIVLDMDSSVSPATSAYPRRFAKDAGLFECVLARRVIGHQGAVRLRQAAAKPLSVA